MALVLLLALSKLAVVSGVREVSRQHQTIARLAELHGEELKVQRS